MEQRHSMACFVYGDNKQSYMMIYNAHNENEVWRLPAFCKGLRAEIILDSSDNDFAARQIDSGKAFEIPAWSVTVIKISNTEK